MMVLMEAVVVVKVWKWCQGQFVSDVGGSDGGGVW